VSVNGCYTFALTPAQMLRFVSESVMRKPVESGPAGRMRTIEYSYVKIEM